MARRSQWGTLGLTNHAESRTIISFLETGLFKVLTLPFNVINTTWKDAVDWCAARDIPVIAMNPFAGGLLAQHERLRELSLRYLLRLRHVHPLVAFASQQEVAYARGILEGLDSSEATADDILAEVDRIFDAREPRGAACGYCQPCPQGINVGTCLSYYNLHAYLGLKKARREFNDRQWEDGLRLDRCRECGLCARRCPNHLPVVDLIRRARKELHPRTRVLRDAASRLGALPMPRPLRELGRKILGNG